MVHSSMSPHLFEQNSQNSWQTPPASPTKRTSCALPKLEYFQPTDSTTLAHSFKNIGGIPPFVPFRNSPIFRIWEKVTDSAVFTTMQAHHRPPIHDPFTTTARSYGETPIDP